MNLALLAYELRAAGIKTLTLELDDSSRLPPMNAETSPLASGVESDTEPPPLEPEFQPGADGKCAHAGCGEDACGILGGSRLPHLCRTHALARMGIK